MKRLFTLATFVALAMSSLVAQSPNLINYQAVARDGNGDIMANQTINVTFLIHSGSAGGTVVFEEDHTSITTNDFGLFALHVGGGSNVSGSIGGIDWGADSYWLEVEVNGASIGATQLVSVPYAMDAAGPWARNGNELNFMNNVGIGVTNPGYRLHVESGSAAIAQFDGSSSAYIRISESGTNRAYMGSYSGNPEDADFGTVTGSTGKTHLVTDATPRLTVDANGLVGIGTTAPGSGLYLTYSTGVGNAFTLNNNADSDEWEMYMWSTNDLRFYFNGMERSAIDDVTGNYTAVSDIRLKENVRLAGEVLPKVQALQVKEYSYIADPTHTDQIGLIAQEAHELFPELVKVGEQSDEGPAMWMVNYAGFSIVAIKAIQEQQAQMEAMQAEIDALKQALKEGKR